MKVDEVIHRMKNLQRFEIVAALPDEFEFRGVVPFDIHVRDGIITGRVWAVTLTEAQQRFNEYLNKDY
jgi:hypothetical protein